MTNDLYLGYRNDDADTPFGKFFKPEMAPLPRHVVEALEHGPQGGMALPAFRDAASVADAGYRQTENGYGVLDDGSLQVSVRTDMPGVTPAMWAWWFGWHGCDTRRYKLWHPRAHLSAAWKDGDADMGAGRRGGQRYIGRCSMISEYIGSALLNGAIQFVAPAAMGLPPDNDSAVAICARLGSGDAPLDIGWFVHHIRSTPTGAEMRSRFWMGGPLIAVHNAPSVASRAVRPIASRIIGPPEIMARNLLVHCAQEMNHLAGFLPELYEVFGDE
jgi:DAPG hydrolase PhiG domain